MAFRPAIAVLDACVLYPFHLRNIVVQAAVDRLVEARWTDEIHDEWMRSLAARTPTIPMDRLQITRRLMNDALPTATVSDYAGHIPSVTLPDPEDRHVVAAAIAAGAALILTWNLRDFPMKELKKFNLHRETPDAFLTGLYHGIPELTIASLANARCNLSRSRVSAGDFVEILNRCKLTRLAKQAQKHLADL
jgi:PIN domain